MSHTTQPSVAGRFANRSNASCASARSLLGAALQQRLHQNAGTPNAEPEPSCLVQLVDGLAHHRNGSIAVAAPGPLRAGQQLGDRNEVGATPAQPRVARTHHQLQPAVTVGRGVPIQQRNTQTALGHAHCGIVAGPLGRLHRLLARAHRGVIGPKHPVLYFHTVGPEDDKREELRIAVSGHRDGVVEVLAPSGTAQPPPSDAAMCQRDRQR